MFCFHQSTIVNTQMFILDYLSLKLGKLKVYVTKFTFLAIYPINIVRVWCVRAYLLIKMIINLLNKLILGLNYVYFNNCYTFHLFWAFLPISEEIKWQYNVLLASIIIFMKFEQLKFLIYHFIIKFKKSKVYVTNFTFWAILIW